MNQAIIDAAATVFEKNGDLYEATKTRFDDVIRGARYTEDFVKQYARFNENVVIDHGKGKLDTIQALNEALQSPYSKSPTITYKVDGVEDIMKLMENRGNESIREDTINQAKRDLINLQVDNYGRKMYEYYMYLCSAEYVVNKEKRTVVALLRHRFDGIVSRGIAKCDPDDCFNTHIGKAIALRRALGLNVPPGYLNAPAPEGVEVGDVIAWIDDSSGDVDIVKKVTSEKVIYENSGFDYIADFNDKKLGIFPRVIDDSARYE
jgi:hypothetical protein